MKRLYSLPLKQQGVTLIELMISLTIGLIIMVAVIGAYLGASGAGRAAEAVGRMNEDGQAALTILSQQLRMAGVNPTQPDRGTATGVSARGLAIPRHNNVTNAFAVRGCDLKFSDVTSAASTVALTCGHSSSSTGPDSISIAYEVDSYNTVANGSGVPTDCVGTGITPSTFSYTKSDGITISTTAVYEAENRFYIGTSSYIVNPTLYCKGNGNGSTQQPLVENIEDMQITYGVVNPANVAISYVSLTPTFTTTLVLGYLSANGVDTDATLTGAAGSATRWNAVKTVRICVVARSENPVLDNIESAKYLDCSGTLVSPADKRLRRAYSTTLVLRNE